jgi:hypothetical protein
MATEELSLCSQMSTQTGETGGASVVHSHGRSAMPRAGSFSNLIEDEEEFALDFPRDENIAAKIQEVRATCSPGIARRKYSPFLEIRTIIIPFLFIPCPILCQFFPAAICSQPFRAT